MSSFEQPCAEKVFRVEWIPRHLLPLLNRKPSGNDETDQRPESHHHTLLPFDEGVEQQRDDKEYAERDLRQEVGEAQGDLCEVDVHSVGPNSLAALQPQLSAQ